MSAFARETPPASGGDTLDAVPADLRAVLSRSVGVLSWRETVSGRERVAGCIGAIIPGGRILTAGHCIQTDGEVRFTLADEITSDTSPEDIYALGVRVADAQKSTRNDIAYFVPTAPIERGSPIALTPQRLAQGAWLVMPQLNIYADPITFRFSECEAPALTRGEAYFNHDCLSVPSTSGAPLVVVHGEEIGIGAVNHGGAQNTIGENKVEGEFDALSLLGVCRTDPFVRELWLGAGARPFQCGQRPAPDAVVQQLPGQNPGVVTRAPKAPIARVSSDLVAPATASEGRLTRLVFLPDVAASARGEAGAGRVIEAAADGRLNAVTFSHVEGRIAQGDAIPAGTNAQRYLCPTLKDIDYSTPTGNLVLACGEFMLRLSDGTPTRRVPLDQWQVALTERRAFAVAAHPSLAVVAVGGDDCSVSLVSSVGPEILASPVSLGIENCSTISSLAFSPSGERLVAIASNRVCLFAVAADALRLISCTEETLLNGQTLVLSRAAFVDIGGRTRIDLVVGSSEGPLQMEWSDDLDQPRLTLLSSDLLSEAGSDVIDVAPGLDGGFLIGTDTGNVVGWRLGPQGQWRTYTSVRGVQLPIAAVMAVPVEAVFDSDCVQRGMRDPNAFVAYATEGGHVQTALVRLRTSSECYW